MAGLPRYSFVRYNLFRTWLLLNRLAPAYKSLASYFITGSKGKGTVAATLAAILKSGNVACGRLTSPHLVRFSERINFAGNDIPDGDLACYLRFIRANLPQLPGKYGTWVMGEILLAAALLWFRDMGAEAVVIEAGLGGRLDPGNIFRRPLAVCVTTVALEHQAVLGNSIAAIAAEKGGAVKPATPLVTAADGDAWTVLEQRCRRLGAPLYAYPADFGWRENGRLALPGLSLTYSGEFVTPADKVNAALAACLASFWPGLTGQAIVQGFCQRPQLPGRFEILATKPPVVLDVAHTPEAVANLITGLKRRFPGASLAFVAGFMADKRIADMLTLLTAAGSVLLAPIADEGGYRPGDVGVPVLASVAAGLAAASVQADIVCVTGSFAAVRAARLSMGCAASPLAIPF